MKKRRFSDGEGEADVPDALRCRRSDGRKWRCRRRAMPGVVFCKHHYLSIKSREELRKRNRRSEKPPVELMEMAIKRQMERRGKRMGKERETEVRVELPNGVMAISSTPAGPTRVPDNAGGIVDRKFGLGFGDGCLSKRRFRSKNAEPMPVVPVKKLPMDLGGRQECGEESLASPVRAMENTCEIVNRKLGLGFGDDYLLKRRFRSKNVAPMHVKKLPRVLGGSQRKICKGCGEENDGISSSPVRASDDDGEIEMLPVQQLNWEEMSELEIEANNKGGKLSGFQLQVAEYGHDEQLMCNYCRTSIGNFHRSCSNCSYKLCLCCCREIRRGSLLSEVDVVSCKYPNGRIAYEHVRTLDGAEIKFRKLHSPVVAERRDKNRDDSICCPPNEHGGCDGVLNMKFLLPLDWKQIPVHKCLEDCLQL